jgi:hypothetical protein
MLAAVGYSNRELVKELSQRIQRAHRSYSGYTVSSCGTNWFFLQNVFLLPGLSCPWIMAFHEFRALTERERENPALFTSNSDLLGVYAAFFICFALTLAQRARCAAAIFRRAATESVRFGRFGFARIPVPIRPTKSPIIWITWFRRLRSCSNSFNTPARFAMASPLCCLE